MFQQLALAAFLVLVILTGYILYLYFRERFPQILIVALASISLLFASALYLIYFTVRNYSELSMISKLIASSGAFTVFFIYLYKLFVDEENYIPFEPQIISAIFGLTMAAIFVSDIRFVVINGLLLPDKTSMAFIIFTFGLLLIVVFYPLLKMLNKSYGKLIVQRNVEAIMLFSGITIGFTGIFLILYNPFEEVMGYEITFMIIGVLFFLTGVIRNPLLIYTFPLRKFAIFVLTNSGLPVYTFSTQKDEDLDTMIGYISLVTSLFDRLPYTRNKTEKIKSFVIEHDKVFIITFSEDFVVVSIGEQFFRPLIYIQQKIASEIEKEFPGTLESALQSKTQLEHLKKLIDRSLNPIRRLAS